MVDTSHMTPGKYDTFWCDVGASQPDLAAEGLTCELEFLEKMRGMRIYKSDSWDLVPELVEMADAILTKRAMDAF